VEELSNNSFLSRFAEEEQQMSIQRVRFLSTIRIVWLVALLCGSPVLAGDDQDPNDARLVGTWRNTVNGGMFFSITAFNQGGTMTDRFSLGPMVSVGNGVWTKIPGRGNFAATFEVFQDTNSDGFFDTRFRIRMTIRLLDHDRYTATFKGDAVSLDGTTLLGPQPGGTIDGTRMQVIRE
jgi:hypothetical protein